MFQIPVVGKLFLTATVEKCIPYQYNREHVIVFYIPTREKTKGLSIRVFEKMFSIYPVVGEKCFQQGLGSTGSRDMFVGAPADFIVPQEMITVSYKLFVPNVGTKISKT